MLFERYFGMPISLKKQYRNRLRDDKGAGCKFKFKNNVLFFNDYAESRSYDVIEWVKCDYGLTYGQALEKIAEDFRYSDNTAVQVFEYEDLEKEETLIQIEVQPYTKKFVNYFEDHLIHPENCQKDNVYCASKVFINGQEVKLFKDELVIAYYFPDINKLKILRPEQSKNYKWRSNVPNTYIDGINELDPNVKHAILLKSKKDKVFIKQLGFKNVLSTQMEGKFVVSEENEKILSNYRKIIWMDNDETGKSVSDYYAEHGYNPILLPDYYREVFGVTDPTDYSRVFKETSQIVKLINDVL